MRLCLSQSSAKYRKTDTACRAPGRRRPRLALEPLEDRLAPADWSGIPSSDTTWTNTEVQHIVGTVTVAQGVTLTVQPGTIVKVNYGNNNLVVSGTLLVQGSGAQPVIFTSFRDDSAGGDTNNDGASSGSKGDWGTIQLNAAGGANVLDHMEVRYGGGWDQAAAVTDSGAPLTLTNSVATNSYTAGLRVAQASPTVSGDTFQNNNGAAVSTDLASHPAITNVTVASNGLNGLVLDSGTKPQPANGDGLVVRDLKEPQTITIPRAGIYQVDVFAAAGTEVKAPKEVKPAAPGKKKASEAMTATRIAKKPLVVTISPVASSMVRSLRATSSACRAQDGIRRTDGL